MFHERKLRLVRSALDDLQGHAGASAQVAAERVEEAAGELARYAREATDCLEDWGRSARKSMERDPVTWSLVSLGAVALIGIGAALMARQRIQEEKRERARANAQLRRSRSPRVAQPKSAARGNSATAKS